MNKLFYLFLISSVTCRVLEAAAPQGVLDNPIQPVDASRDAPVDAPPPEGLPPEGKEEERGGGGGEGGEGEGGAVDERPLRGRRLRFKGEGSESLNEVAIAGESIPFPGFLNGTGMYEYRRPPSFGMRSFYYTLPLTLLLLYVGQIIWSSIESHALTFTTRLSPLIRMGAFMTPSKSIIFGCCRTVTASLLHYNHIHILGNLLCLHSAMGIYLMANGQHINRSFYVWVWPVFLWCAICGNAYTALRQSNRLVCGASGGAFGLATTCIFLAVLTTGFRILRYPICVAHLVGLTVGLMLGLLPLQLGKVGVAVDAHLGGAVGGLAAGLLMYKLFRISVTQGVVIVWPVGVRLFIGSILIIVICVAAVALESVLYNVPLEYLKRLLDATRTHTPNRRLTDPRPELLWAPRDITLETDLECIRRKDMFDAIVEEIRGSFQNRRKSAIF